jgi:YbbR domain-containing protein
VNRALSSLTEAWRIAVALLAAGVTNITSHWSLALVSLVAAFGIWMVIQDVENPRVEGEAPASGGIQVTAVNVAQGCLVEELQSVRVRVDAREGLLGQLRPSDFSAEIDVRDVRCDTGDQPVQSRPVRVISRRDDVKVIEAIPDSVEFRLIRAAEREIPVTIRVTAQPPFGYGLSTEAPPIPEPAAVKVRGRPEQVESVVLVQWDVSLAGVRDTTQLEGDLVARNAAGDTVQVSISPAKARATFRVEQLLSQRQVALVPGNLAQPAPGYRVANITIEPPTVQIAGPKAIIDQISQLVLEPHDITGAERTITVTKNITRPPNVTLTDRQTATLRIEIVPIVCGEGSISTCAAQTFFLAPAFTDRPEGLVVVGGPYRVEVQLAGPLAQLNALRPLQDLSATISLAGATGPGAYVATPSVSVPSGIRVVAVAPIAVTLQAATSVVP